MYPVISREKNKKKTPSVSMLKFRGDVNMRALLKSPQIKSGDTVRLSRRFSDSRGAALHGRSQKNGPKLIRHLQFPVITGRQGNGREACNGGERRSTAKTPAGFLLPAGQTLTSNVMSASLQSSSRLCIWKWKFIRRISTLR